MRRISSSTVPTKVCPTETRSKKAQESSCESLEWKDCVGRVAADYVYLYPPGIPLVVPGEEITEECIALWNYFMKNGLELKGLESEKMLCVAENLKK